MTDAHVAALALEHAAWVVSYDRDFLRWGVPLEVPARPVPRGTVTGRRS